MKLKQLIAGAAAAFALAATTASDAATVVIHKPHRTIVERHVPARFIARDRVVEVVRARGIRVAGAPYMYRGMYVVRCYDRFGRIAFCRIHPRTGAFLGVSVRL
jgi:hypothetical protein